MMHRSIIMLGPVILISLYASLGLADIGGIGSPVVPSNPPESQPQVLSKTPQANTSSSVTPLQGQNGQLDAPVLTSPGNGFTETKANVIVSGKGVPGAAVTIFDAGVPIGTFTVNRFYYFTSSVPLSNGKHSFSATQALNGQTSPSSSTVNFSVEASSSADNVSPKSLPVMNPTPQSSSPSLASRPTASTVPNAATSIVATMSSERGNYRVGEPIRMGLSYVTHVPNLSMTVGTDKEKFWITQNGTTIWQTKDCTIGHDIMRTWQQPSGNVHIDPQKVQLIFDCTWDGHIKDLQGNISLPAVGQYQLNGQIDGITALPITITLQ